jgi:hypothetical protein
VKPTDIIEKMWVQDVVDLVWEILRLRRLKASMMAATAYKGLRGVLEPLMKGPMRAYPEQPSDFSVSNKSALTKLIEEWGRQKSRAIDRVDRMLASAGLTMDAVMALTLSENLDKIERIERMIVIAQTRRDATLDEIDRRRARLGRALRLAALPMDDGADLVVEPEPMEGGVE